MPLFEHAPKTKIAEVFGLAASTLNNWLAERIIVREDDDTDRSTLLRLAVVCELLAGGWHARNAARVAQCAAEWARGLDKGDLAPLDTFLFVNAGGVNIDKAAGLGRLMAKLSQAPGAACITTLPVGLLLFRVDDVLARLYRGEAVAQPIEISPFRVVH
ncbi:MAG: hypothetical protein RLO50_04440 [Azospirillaceae bacterium]